MYHVRSVHEYHKSWGLRAGLCGVKKLYPAPSDSRGGMFFNHLLYCSVDSPCAYPTRELLIEELDFPKEFHGSRPCKGRKIDPWGKGDEFQLPVYLIVQVSLLPCVALNQIPFVNNQNHTPALFKGIAADPRVLL